MTKKLTLLLGLTAIAASLTAATGGPDTYGYTWTDSNEPGGPVYGWIDITTTGSLVTGLADDNVVGPFLMATNMPFYWYDAKKVWIGSNGYLAFNNVNMAAAFDTIPNPGGGNDFLAGMMSDLTFTGTGNPAQCFLYDDPSATIVSFIDVPFWSPTAPQWTGSNTFQFILNKTDSTITFQYQSQTGLTQSDNITIGIESITGDIGLQHSANTYPQAGHAIRFTPPAVPLIDIVDATVEWLGMEGSQGIVVARDGPALDMTVNVRNTGNQDILGALVEGRMLSLTGSPLASDALTVGMLAPGIDTTIIYGTTWQPNQSGTFRFQGEISGIANELVTTNNLREREVLVLDTNASLLNIDWAGAGDDGVGLGWNGGNGGVGVEVLFPSYPANVTAATVRITSNTGLSAYTVKVYDDDGPDGTPGTLLDSLFIPGASATTGDQVLPLNAPILVSSGSLYVQWYMQGPNVNIARDIIPPFSFRTYEVLDNVWAEYRDRDIADFHLGLQVTPPPVFDAGATAFFGLIDGLTVTGPTTVRTWIRNFGNQPINNFPVNYQFENDPVVTQTYGGPAIAPGDSSLFSFSTQFQPAISGPGIFCSWVDLPADGQSQNDTTCVSITIALGVLERGIPPLTIRPNPAREQVLVSGLDPGPVELMVTDMTGRMVSAISVLYTSEGLLVPLDDLSSGTYLLRTDQQGSLRMSLLVVER